MTLARADVRFVVIGGVALQLHGSSYTTFDLDIAYERSRANAIRLATVLAPLDPRPREFPPDAPFVFDDQTLMTHEILTLETTAGDIDLLASVLGIGTYQSVLAFAEPVPLEDAVIQVLSIEGLLIAKRATNRPKDREGILELEALDEATRLKKQSP